MAISSLASRATASTLFFTNVLLRLNRSPPMVAPLAATRSGVARSVHTGRPPYCPNKEDFTPVVKYLELLESSEHPFIRRGPPSPFLGLVYGDKIYIRIDMPGVGKEGLKIWAEKYYYVFQAVESIDIDDQDHHYERRVYSERMMINPALVVKDSIKAIIQNGLLRIVFRLRC